MYLSRWQLDHLRSQAEEVCPQCHHPVRQNYCRDHDDFFDDGHAEACRLASEHGSHSTYRKFDYAYGEGLEKMHAELRREGSIERICMGCDEVIEIGQHYMKMRIELDTDMGPDWRPVVEVEPTVFDLQLHGPGCFVIWVDQNPIMRSVFAR